MSMEDDDMSESSECDSEMSDSDLWEGQTEKCCGLLARNDASMKTVYLFEGNQRYWGRICSSLKSNTVVEKAFVSCEAISVHVVSSFNQFIESSPSLKVFDFYTCNISSGFEQNAGGLESLRMANKLLYALYLARSIETLCSVPLCYTTCRSVANCLRNKNVRNLSIDLPLEPIGEESVPDIENYIRDRLGPIFRQSLATSDIETLSINWMEHEVFPTGSAFVCSLPGSFPPSLRHVEFSNFKYSRESADAISNAIEQSHENLDSINFSFCQNQAEALDMQILRSIEKSKPQLRALHYGYLLAETTQYLLDCINRSSFVNLAELGVGFHDDFELFEYFCQRVHHNVSIEVLDIQLWQSDENAKRFLSALAVLLSKLPNLKSITSDYLWWKVSLTIDNVPEEFYKALTEHKHLESFIPNILFPDNRVEFYLKRNKYRYQLAAEKPKLVEAIESLDDGTPASLSVVSEVLTKRMDWHISGLDEGRPIPSPTLNDAKPSHHRFNRGLLF